MILSVQFYTLIVMIGMGIVLGMAVETYHLLLRVKIQRNWSKWVCDLLFWIVYALLLFYTLYWINEGTLRIHVFLAIFCGFAMYKSLFSSVYIYIMYFVYRIISKTVYFSIKVLNAIMITPVYWSIIKVLLVTVWLLMVIYRTVKLIMCTFFRSLYWIMKIFFGMLPKTVQKRLELLYYRVYKKVWHIYRGCMLFYYKLKSWLDDHK